MCTLTVSAIDIAASYPVRCYKCNRKLADAVSGNEYRIEFTCPKCKCSFAVTPNGIQPISIGKM